jgi:hypothetical protein
LSFLEIRNKRTGERKQLKICYTGKNMVLAADETTGQIYQCVDTSAYTQSKNHGFGFGCQETLCKQRLNRPHLTCLGFCAFRRVLKGEIPPIVAVYPYVLLRLPDKFRHHIRIKDLLAKKLLVVVEYLVST